MKLRTSILLFIFIEGIFYLSCPLRAEAITINNYKFGAGVPDMFELTQQTADAMAINLKNNGIYHIFDWGAFPSTAEAAKRAGIEYHPMVWGCKGALTSTEITALQNFARAYPSSRWFIYNEPDETGQADCKYGTEYFEQAVDRYFNLTKIILTADPTAEFGCCGELRGPYRLSSYNPDDNIRYLWIQKFYERFTEKYGRMPINFLHVHLYEIGSWDNFNIEKIKAEYDAWENWRANSPWAKDLKTFISEYGPLSNTKDPAQWSRIVNEYIPNIVPWLLQKPNVTGALWFSTYYQPISDPGLCTTQSCNSLSVVGQKYVEYKNLGIFTSEPTCGAGCSSLEIRQGVIETYCNEAGSCTGGKVWANPMKCHSGQCSGWANYGSSCSSPWCECECIMPTPTLTPTLTPTTGVTCQHKSKGDADCDDAVNLVDFTIWKNEYLKIAAALTADFNNSDAVDLIDFTIWKNGYLSL